MVVLFFFLINLFLAALDLRCCSWASSDCGERGPLFVAVCKPLLAVASLVVEHGLSSCGSRAPERRLSSRGTRAQSLRGMWDPPGPGLEPVSPALAGRFPTTEPPGKSRLFFFVCLFLILFFY